MRSQYPGAKYGFPKTKSFSLSTVFNDKSSLIKLWTTSKRKIPNCKNAHWSISTWLTKRYDTNIWWWWWWFSLRCISFHCIACIFTLAKYTFQVFPSWEVYTTTVSSSDSSYVQCAPSCNYYSSSQFSDFCVFLSIYLAVGLLFRVRWMAGWMDEMERTDGRENCGKSVSNSVWHGIWRGNFAILGIFIIDF